ncbi:MAG: xanthine phosphoribosyltransferase [Lachnospiraceae bacterium]|nr:xanthine phosphoribosyltransferase [Lachnospiraceae bacterium]
MELLEKRIVSDGQVKSSEILKVDSFLNHQLDPELFLKMGEEWKRLYEGCEINKIVTIEASGIAIACMAGLIFGCPVVFAKKGKSRNVSDSCYSTIVHSFTHGYDNLILISKEHLFPEDKVLIIDDFMANGAALEGLIELIEQAGATVVGCGIAIEKAFQPGGDRIRSKGYRVESLARIASMDPENGITFVR